MRTVVLGTMLTVSILVATRVSSAAEKSDAADSAKQQIAQIEGGWVEALMKRNVVWFERTISDDWKVVYPDGTIRSKKESIQPIKDGTLIAEEYTIAEMNVRVWGDAAVVVAKGKAKGNYKDQAFDHQEHWTDMLAARSAKAARRFHAPRAGVSDAYKCCFPGLTGVKRPLSGKCGKA